MCIKRKRCRCGITIAAGVIIETSEEPLLRPDVGNLLWSSSRVAEAFSAQKCC